MVRIDSIYDGDLHTTTVHVPSGARIATDAPADNQGRGEAFSPTDLVAAALGSCTLTIMGIVARREGWPLEGARVSVEKEMAADPHRRIAKLTASFQMPRALPEASRAVLERAAHGCPVQHSLDARTAVTLRFDYTL